MQCGSAQWLSSRSSLDGILLYHTPWLVFVVFVGNVAKQKSQREYYCHRRVWCVRALRSSKKLVQLMSLLNRLYLNPGQNHVWESQISASTWGRCTGTICNSLKHKSKLLFLPYFQLAIKGQLSLLPSLNHRNIPSSIAYRHISQLFLTQILAFLHWFEFHCIQKFSINL